MYVCLGVRVRERKREREREEIFLCYSVTYVMQCDVTVMYTAFCAIV